MYDISITRKEEDIKFLTTCHVNARVATLTNCMVG